MKLFAIPVFICLLTFGCSKEKFSPIVSLELSYEPNKENIEWDHITGQYYLQDGRLTIEGESFSGEIFRLNLHNVFDTGMLNNLTLQQVFFHDGSGFIPEALSNNHIKIQKLEPGIVEGSLEAIFTRQAFHQKIKGRFKIIFHP
jgi:hypothetical protein